MSDSLRDRIAAVLAGNLPLILEYEHYTDDELNEANLTLGAMIAALGPLVRYWDSDFKELHYCRECGGWGPKDD